MLNLLEVLGGILLFSLFASYLGYPFLIALLKPIHRGEKRVIPNESIIHLIIPCYNEESVLEEKVRNSFNIDYPREFRVYIVIDQSDDKTVDIAGRLATEYSNLIVLDKGHRKGKNDSINYFFKEIKPKTEDIIFFTDANTFYNRDSFMKLWEKLEEGAAVVGGSMQYIDQKTNSAKSEGLYWKYEEWIRRNEDKFGRAITMNGGNMAMIAKYFKELPLYVPNDFYIPISLVSSYKTSFASTSLGIEKAILNEKEELKRKKRMANRQMNAIIHGWSGFSFVTKLQLLFHKIVRWFAVPIFFLISVITLFIDLMNCNDVFHYTFFFVIAWGIALLSLFISQVIKEKLPILATISYAFLVHYFGGIGAFQAFVGERVSQWGKAASNR